MASTVVATRQQGTLGKYKGLAISLIILVLLVVALLILNLFFSRSLENNAQVAAAASRQVGLVQEISKDLILINSQYQKVLPYEEEKSALKQAMDTFDSTLNAFSDGGVVSIAGVNGVETIQVDKLSSSKSTQVINEAKSIWGQYLEKTRPIFEGANSTQSQLIDARDLADENTVRLISLMEQLSEEIQLTNDQSILQLRVVQIVGIFATVLVFFFTVFVTIRNLRKNDAELDRARQETQGILNTVKEGLFLLDNDLVISSQHSKEMLDIFEIDSISGREFSQLISEILGEKDLSTIEEFVKLLFDEHVIEGLIGSLNPLDKVEMTFTKSDGSVQKKFLNFDFFRVVRENQIQEILVSVRDITSRVLLEQELENTKEQGEQQVEMLVSFLQAEPKMLRAFLLDSRESLGEVNSILKDPVMDKADLKGKIDKMFVSIHRMKGEASAMNFDAFAEKAHEFEADLSELKRVTNIKGLDFLPLTIRLDKLISYTDTLNELSNRLEGGTGKGDTTIMAASPVNPQQASEWAHLDQLVEKVAADTGKQVRLVKSGLLENVLNDQQNRMIKDVCIQLLRNSIAHGIETPEERTKVRKSAFGRIDLRLATLPDGSIELVVRDDGRGLDIASIKERILKKGLATADDLKTWSNQKIISMAFSSGFSTSKETNVHSGRGVGLDIIRDSVKKIGGDLRLRQAAGKYCQFEIVLPAAA